MHLWCGATCISDAVSKYQVENIGRYGVMKSVYCLETQHTKMQMQVQAKVRETCSFMATEICIMYIVYSSKF